MSEDIVARLRADLASGLSASIGDTKEAADEIERLRAALKQIADMNWFAVAAEVARAALEGEKKA